MVYAVPKGRRNGEPVWHVYILDGKGLNQSRAFRRLARLYKDHLVIHEDPASFQERLRESRMENLWPAYHALERQFAACTGGKRCSSQCGQTAVAACALRREYSASAPAYSQLALLRSSKVQIKK